MAALAHYDKKARNCLEIHRMNDSPIEATVHILQRVNKSQGLNFLENVSGTTTGQPQNNIFL